MIKRLFVDQSSMIMDEWWGYVYKCPYCDSNVIWQDFKFCPICGIKTHFHKIKKGGNQNG